MSIHQSIAEGGATPVGEPKTPQPAAAPRIPVSGANAADIELSIKRVRVTMQLARSVVLTTMDQLNENLPVTATIDFNDQMDLLYDIEGDLIGKLANAKEQL